MVAESNDAEEDRQQDETNQLNGLAADRVHSKHGAPVAWDGTSADQDDVSDCHVPVILIDGVVVSEANGR